MDKPKFKIAGIVLSVLLVASVGLNIILFLNNRELNQRYEQQEQQWGFLPVKNTYIYKTDSAVLFDLVIDSHNMDIAQCDVVITDGYLPSFIKSSEVSYFEHEGDFGIRVTFIPVDNVTIDNLYERTTTAVEHIVIHAMGKNGYEVNQATVEYEETPPYKI